MKKGIKKLKTNSSTILAGLAFCLLLSSCATYHMTSESLQSQISSAVPAEGSFVFVTGGLFLFNRSMNNGIRDLVVIDKEGKEKRIRVSQRTQIRIYTKDGDYSTFYFDTLFFHDNCVVGDRTHFFPSKIKPIPFSEITKIELQR